MHSDAMQINRYVDIHLDVSTGNEFVMWGKCENHLSLKLEP